MERMLRGRMDARESEKRVFGCRAGWRCEFGDWRVLSDDCDCRSASMQGGYYYYCLGCVYFMKASGRCRVRVVN